MEKNELEKDNIEANVNDTDHSQVSIIGTWSFSTWSFAFYF